MKNLYTILFIILSFFHLSCGIEEALKQEYLNEGIWRGIIKIQGQEVPFNFEVIREDSVTYDLNIINGKERINIKGLAMQGDSVFIPIYLFDAVIKAKLDNKKLVGVFEKNYDKSSVLPFEASHNKSYRFESKMDSKENVDGKWEVTFLDKDEKTSALGIFTQTGNKVEGTFLTSLGDFRYLEGIVEGKKLYLSTFDGANTLLFKAEINNNSMDGHFWSGSFGYQSWKAVRNEDAKLPRLAKDTLTNELNRIFNFNLTDLNGKKVSLTDAKFDDKVKVIHLFGSWCPNSIDEIRFLAEWQKQNKGTDVVVLGLAFEPINDFTYAKNRINNIQKKLNANYDFLIAGIADKAAAVENFAALSSIETFPTTIVLDKKNKIRKINSGFRSPATGIFYQNYIKEFNEFVNNLMYEGKEAGVSYKTNSY